MPMTEKEKFDIARELIRHEDGLINNRVSWLMVFQGFLFASFVTGLGLFEKFKGNEAALNALAIALFILGVLGLISAVIAYFSTRMAFDQAERVKVWWLSCGVADQFPPVSGPLGVTVFGRTLSAAVMLVVLVATWLAFLVLFSITPR